MKPIFFLRPPQLPWIGLAAAFAFLAVTAAVPAAEMAGATQAVLSADAFVHAPLVHGQTDPEGPRESETQPCKRRVGARRIQQAVELAAENSDTASGHLLAAPAFFRFSPVIDFTVALDAMPPIYATAGLIERAPRIGLSPFLGQAPPTRA